MLTIFNFFQQEVETGTSRLLYNLKVVPLTKCRGHGTIRLHSEMFKFGATKLITTSILITWESHAYFEIRILKIEIHVKSGVSKPVTSVFKINISLVKIWSSDWLHG